MKFQKSIIEDVKERKSTRTYDPRAIETNSLDKLQGYIEEINKEAIAFSMANTRFLFMSTNEITNSTINQPLKDTESNEKLGTYGMISGAHSYIIGITDKNQNNPVKFGYLFEKIILFATDIGLQTCWLGGTFNREDFNKKVTLNDDEYMPIISPVGYKKDKPRIAEVAIRKAIGADKRKPWEQLFFDESVSMTLDKSKAGQYKTALEMVRLGPSASNKQPWRVIKKENRFYFFLSRTKGYGAAGFDIQKNDIGIAMCHFELAANEAGLDGKWTETCDITIPEDMEYIATWS